MDSPTQMIALQRQKVLLQHVNLRAEMHGEEWKPACDLKIRVEVPNEVLERFDKGLRAALYRKPSKSADPDFFDGRGEANGELPPLKLRFPKMAPMGWNLHSEGYNRAIEYGIDESSWLRFPVPKLDRFTLAPKDGGTVMLSFRAVIYPDGKLNELASLMRREITIDLTPPQSGEEPAQRGLRIVDGTRASTTDATDAFAGEGAPEEREAADAAA